MSRKLTVFALVLCMVMSLVPAMSFADAASTDVPNIDWYFGQTEQPDGQAVNDYINEYLKEKVGATVTLHFWSGDQYWDNMNTMISSGQDVGIIGFGSQTKLDYVVNSQRGAYYPIEDMLGTIGADTKALFDDKIWDAMTIDGHIYGIPSKKDNGYFISLIYNATMAEELGIDMENFTYTDMRGVEELGLEVKEKRDAAHPEWAESPIFWINNAEMPYNFALESFLNGNFLAVCDIDAFDEFADYDETQVFSLYGTPEYLEYVIQRQRMTDEGLYLYDTKDKDDLQYDGSMFGWIGWGFTYMEPHMFGDNFETKMIMSDRLWTETNNYFSAGTAISSQCAYPEKAMEILNLVNTDSKFATTMRFGIEGEHYTYDADGKMTFEGTKNADPSSRAYYNWYMAPVGNLLIVEAPEQLTGPDGIMLTNMAKYNEECVVPAHMGFVFDTTPVTNELAACTNVVAEFQDDLVNGKLSSEDEVRDVVAEFNDKLTANGVDKIVAEVQSQIDAWTAAKAAE